MIDRPAKSGSVPTPRRLSPLVVGCLAATWLIWGSTYLAIRFALVGFPPYFLMATRFVCAGGLLMAWQMGRGAALPNGTEWRNALLVGALMLGGGMGGVAFAEQTIASGLVVAFIAVIPLLLVLINVAFGVYPRRSELLAITVGLAGVLMLTQGPGMRGSPAGLLAIALSTTSWALGSVLSQRLFRLAPGATGFASEMLCGGLVLLAISALRGEPWHWPLVLSAWLAWGYLVFLGSLVAFNAYMLLLARTSSSLAASYSLVNPVVALCLGVTLGAESVSMSEWLSAGVVVVGVVLLLKGQRAGRAPVAPARASQSPHAVRPDTLPHDHS
jgi:drug/metabolite transporter (DMT)-like permease